MPGLNGTGPRGEGAMTGRGRGNCVATLKGEVAGVNGTMGAGFGMGRGMGRGMGCGFGRGRANGGKFLKNP